MYPIFDVYNNAYRNGGNLNITLDRYYIYRNPEFNLLTESILQKRTKYENRADMSDLSMRVATVVRIFLCISFFQNNIRYWCIRRRVPIFSTN